MHIEFIHRSVEAVKGALSFIEKLNHTNWHSSQALVHGNDVTMHERHLEKVCNQCHPAANEAVVSSGRVLSH